jgi:hypothetical protein
MKTNLKKLFLVVAVAVPFMFTSCTESTDDRATITVDQASITIAENGNFLITGTVTSPEGTRIDDIEARLVHGDHTHLIADNSRGNSTFTEVSSNHFTFRIDQDHEALAEALDKVREESPELTSVVLRLTATVRNGGAPTERNVTINLGGEQGTELSAAIPFEWTRVGGANATGGLADFGLRLNNTGTAVQILSSATRLVSLTPADWAEITTKEELKARIDAATVAASIDFTFATDTNPNRVFGVLHEETYHIFHVTRFRSTAAPGDGTRTSILNGNRKN